MENEAVRKKVPQCETSTCVSSSLHTAVIKCGNVQQFENLYISALSVHPTHTEYTLNPTLNAHTQAHTRTHTHTHTHLGQPLG